MPEVTVTTVVVSAGVPPVLWKQEMLVPEVHAAVSRFKSQKNANAADIKSNQNVEA